MNLRTILQALRPVWLLFAALAVVGLILSLLSHISALAGRQGPLGNYAWLLHIGIFVVWLPTVIVANILTRGANRKDFWKVAMGGCPAWMRVMVYVFIGYAVLNFLYFIAIAPKQSGAGPMPPEVVRGFSGHWMVFYAAALAVLYSAAQERSQGRRCPNGHEVPEGAECCSQCGERALERKLENKVLGT